jgi:hypothetical protein
MQNMSDFVLPNGTVKVGVLGNVSLDKDDLFELILAQDGAQAMEAGIDVKNIGRVPAFEQNFGNPRADKAFGSGNKKAFLEGNGLVCIMAEYYSRLLPDRLAQGLKPSPMPVREGRRRLGEGFPP